MADYKRIEKLMLFAEVAQTLNFSRAAEQLGISKSYLSEQIKRLESELASPFGLPPLAGCLSSVSARRRYAGDIR